jgi:hypothetical protein
MLLDWGRMFHVEPPVKKPLPTHRRLVPTAVNAPIRRMLSQASRTCREKAAFQLEDSLQTAAQVFAAPLAPSASVNVVVGPDERLAGAAGALVRIIHIGQTRVDKTVQGHTALRVCGGADCRERRGEQHLRLHQLRP